MSAARPFKQIFKKDPTVTGDDFTEIRIAPEMHTGSIQLVVPTGSAAAAAVNDLSVTNLGRIERRRLGATAWILGTTAVPALPAAGASSRFSITPADLEAHMLRLRINLSVAGPYEFALVQSAA